MSKYNLDLDYVTPLIDISREELNEIIDVADKIIHENKESPENLAVAYLKKAQCLQKLEEEHCRNGDYSFVRHHYQYDETHKQIQTFLEKALELFPRMPEALMQMGKLQCDTRGIHDSFQLNDKAINMFTSALELKPDYAAAFNNRGLEYSDFFFPEDEDRKKTISDLTEAIRIRPFDAMYYRNRGMEYLYLNEYEKGIADLSSAINYGSDKFNKMTCIFHDRGKAYMRLKNLDKAIIDLTESIRLRPDKNEFLLTRRDAYLKAGKKDKAKADFDEYLRLKRGQVEA